MTADEFVDLLDERGVLPPFDILSLREQLAASEAALLPVFIARRLVQGGYLNSYLAKTLLAEGAQKYRRPEDAWDEPDEPEIGFLDELDEPKPTVDTAAKWADPLEPAAPNLNLPPLDARDLLFGEDVEEATLLPSAQPTTGFTWPWRAKRPLRLDQPPSQNGRWWIAGGVLVAMVLALLVYLVLALR